MDTHIVLTKHYHYTGQKKKGRDAIYLKKPVDEALAVTFSVYFLVNYASIVLMKTFLLTILAFMSCVLANPNCASEAMVFRLSKTEVIVGVTLTPAAHWHTYWSNPGDAGLALSIELENKGLKVEAEDFSTPIRFEAMGIIGYGYEKAATFLYKVSGEIPEEIKGNASWLVCDATSCVPADASFTLQVEPKPSSELPEWLESAHASQPAPLTITPKEAQQAERSKLITYSFEAEENVEGWVVFPYDDSFSETEGGNQIKLIETSYQFSFELIGELESADFLITNGESAFKITL